MMEREAEGVTKGNTFRKSQTRGGGKEEFRENMNDGVCL